MPGRRSGPTTSSAPATLSQGLERLALTDVPRFDRWAGAFWDADTQVKSKPLEIPSDRFAASLDLIQTWAPWMQEAVMVSAARAALDPTTPEGRQLAAIMVVDRLASPLGLRDSDAVHGTPRNLEAISLAGQVHDAWDAVNQMNESEGLGLTNADLWNEALVTVRDRFDTYQRARNIRLSRPARHVLSPTAQQEVQAALMPAFGEPLGADAAPEAQLAQDRAMDALPFLTGGFSPGVRGRRLVERSLATLLGRRDKASGVAQPMGQKAPDMRNPLDVATGLLPGVDSPGQPEAPPAPDPMDTIRGYVQERDQGPSRTQQTVEALAGQSAPEMPTPDPDASVLEAASFREAQLAGWNEESLRNLGTSWDTAIVRGAVVGISAPYQGLQAMYRNFRSSWNPLTNSEGTISLDDQTDLGQILHSWIDGEPVDTGSGFFVNPDSQVAEDRYRAEILGGEVDGHVLTLGRDVASNMTWFEPDSLPYDTLSGFIDAVAAIALDPLNPVFAAAGRGVKASKGLLADGAFAAEDAARYLASDGAREAAEAFSHVGRVWDETLDEAGNLLTDAPLRLRPEIDAAMWERHGGRLTRDGAPILVDPDFSGAAASGRQLDDIRPVAEVAQSIRDEQIYRAWRASGEGRMAAVGRTLRGDEGRRIPLPIFLRMVDGDPGDADYVLGILQETLGTSLRNKPRAPAEFISRHMGPRRRENMPSREGFHVGDVDRSIIEVERIARIYDLPEEEVAHYVIRAGNLYRPKRVEIGIDELDPENALNRRILRGIAGEGPLPRELRGMDDYELAALANDIELELSAALTPITRNSLTFAPDMEGWFELMMDMAGSNRGALVRHGVPGEQADELVRIWDHVHQSEGRYLVNELGEGIRTRQVFDGENLIDTKIDPHLDTEMFNGHIPGPDARRIRRITSNPVMRFATTSGRPPGRVRLGWAESWSSKTDAAEIRRLRAASSVARRAGDSAEARRLEAAAEDLAESATWGRRPRERFNRAVANRLAPPTRTLGQSRMPIAALDWVQDTLWKPSVLLRLAWPIRVIGEEQLRMAASGMESMFHDPLSYISWAIGRKGADDILGTPLDEWQRFSEALTTRTGGWTDSMRWRRTGEWRSFLANNAQDNEGYTTAWANELAKLSSSRIAPLIADIGGENGYATIDDLIEALWSGKLRGIQEDLVKANPALGVRRQPGMPTWTERFYEAQRSGSTDLPIETLDDWVESIEIRLRIATNYEPTLLQAVRSGKMDVPTALGSRVIRIDSPGTARLEQDFLAHLRGLKADHGPSAVAGPVMTADRLSRGDTVVDSMFALLMGRPTNYLSRAPVFKQMYWSRAEEMIGFATPRAQREIIGAAREAGIEAKVIRDLERAARSQHGLASLEEIDMIAKGHALDDTKWLLYDLSEKSNFFDAARLIFPFGEAWKEVLSRWASIVPNNPKTLLRAEEFMDEARSNTAINRHTDTVTGFIDRGLVPVARFVNRVADPLVPDGMTRYSDTDISPYADGRGFFWENQWGEQVFTYPGSMWMTDRLIGVPIPLTGRAQGLSLATEVLPGFGLAIQMPAQWILAAKPGWGDARVPGMGQSLRELLLPFGTDPSWWSTIAPPAWRMAHVAALGAESAGGWLGPISAAARWIEDSPESDRAWAATTGDMARYLSSTGDYPVDDPDAQERLWNDAAARAAPFFLVQALGKFSAPSSPSPDWLVEDTDGTLVRADYLASEWQRMLVEHTGDYYGAMAAFMNAHGEDNHLIMQPKSVEITMNVPLDPTGYDWTLDNEDIVDRYPRTFGFLAPEPEIEVEASNGTNLHVGDVVSAAEFRAANQAATEAGETPAQGSPPFSSDAWNSALQHGYRESLSARDMAILDQTRMLRFRLYEIEQAFLAELPPGEGLTPQMEDVLSQASDQLRATVYPEAYNFLGMSQRVTNNDREAMIGEPGDREAELRQQLEDDEIDSGYRDGLEALLTVWDSFNEMARSEEGGGYANFYGAQDYADIRRTWRFEIAPALIEEYPRIAGLWQFVFDPMLDREVVAG